MVRRSRGDAGPDPGGGRMTVVDRNDQTKEEGSATTVLAARKPSVDEPELLRLAEAYKAKLQSWTASYQQEVHGETINLSEVTNGPDLAPATGTFGPGFIDAFVMPIPPGTFPVPAQGRPLLYELNFVMDIKGVGPGLPPFAGYAT